MEENKGMNLGINYDEACLIRDALIYFIEHDTFNTVSLFYGNADLKCLFTQLEYIESLTK